MNNIDAVILCGGQGKRLRGVVDDRPKVMSEINNRPFLDILIDYASSYGVRRFILCAGYMADYISNYYKNNKSFGFVISQESVPLDTGGAIKNAQEFIQTNPFLVLNGDSFCPIDLDNFLTFHKNKSALVSVAVVKVNSSSDFGTIILDDTHKVLKFKEKDNTGEAFINAGIYIFENDVLSLIPFNSKFSLEHNLFPNLVDKSFYGFIVNKKLIDIGTPAKLEYAKKYFQAKPQDF